MSKATAIQGSEAPSLFTLLASLIPQHLPCVALLGPGLSTKFP